MSRVKSITKVINPSGTEIDFPLNSSNEVVTNYSNRQELTGIQVDQDKVSLTVTGTSSASPTWFNNFQTFKYGFGLYIANNDTTYPIEGIVYSFKFSETSGTHEKSVTNTIAARGSAFIPYFGAESADWDTYFGINPYDNMLPFIKQWRLGIWIPSEHSGETINVDVEWFMPGTKDLSS